MAADPADPRSGVKPVPLEKINGQAAVRQCLAERKRSPKVARLAGQLGRAYERLGRNGEALAAYKDAAALGSSLYAFRVAQMLRKGAPGVSVDDAGAQDYLRKAANGGNTEAALALADRLQSGRGVEPDKSEAVAILRKAAGKGSVDAMVELGKILRDGDGVRADPRQAFSLFEKAANRGSTQGMINLGLAWRDGVGVHKDPRKSIKLFEQAAVKGDPEANLKLAYAYLTGTGVEDDDRKALIYYQRAATAGSADGMAGVAYIYSNARGVDADPKMAADWLVKALEHGSDYALEQLTERTNEWRPETRKALQEELIARKLFAGPADGTFTGDTLTAIRTLHDRST